MSHNTGEFCRKEHLNRFKCVSNLDDLRLVIESIYDYSLQDSSHSALLPYITFGEASKVNASILFGFDMIRINIDDKARFNAHFQLRKVVNGQFMTELSHTLIGLSPSGCDALSNSLRCIAQWHTQMERGQA